MAIGVIVMYLLARYSDTVVGQSLLVDMPVFIIASITALVSAISYLWIPKKSILPSSLFVYFLLVATVAGLIVTTGGITSLFIALWMLVAVFSGIFGVWGIIPMLLAAGAFAGSEHLAGRLTPELIVVVAFVGILSVIASFIIWHSKSNKVDHGARAYKDLANELSQVASQAEVVINAIGDGVIEIDERGIVHLINPAAQRIIGWGKQDALALSYKSVLLLVNQKGEPLDDRTDPIQQVLNTNQQLRNNNLVIMTHSGKKIMASLLASPIGDVGSGVIIVFRDISKEKAEEREQAEFISTASHEMRTPVASIEGYLGLALNPQTAQIDAKARDFIMKAHESAQHLGRLFQDLLDVSKAEDGRLSNNPHVIDVVAFTHDIVQGLQQKATDKGLNLTFKPMPDDDERHLSPVYNVNLDNDHIREVINNLIENAIKYTLRGEVVVDITGNDEKVVISIQDSGIGIPTEDMSHLFQKFYRVDNVDTRQIGGTGLGLYLCRRLAEVIGGRIWAESVYKQGSTFYFELPRVNNANATRLAEQQAGAVQVATSQATFQPVQLPSGPQTVVASTAPMATTVPRGESLTPEQITAQVVKLQALAKQQTTNKQPVITPKTLPNTPLASIEQNPSAYTRPTLARPPSVSIPIRDFNQPPQ